MKFLDQAWPFSETADGASNHRATADRNRLHLLGLLLRRKCRSQRDLSLSSGLRASTVSNIVNDLKTWGLIRDGEPIDAGRVGPRETELELVANTAWSAGVHLSPAGHRITLVNAQGHVLARETVPMGVTVAELLADLPSSLQALARRLGLQKRRLGGVGMTVPGVVDGERGMVLVSRSLKLESFPVREPLQAAMRCPVWVERDVVCGAYAEHLTGEARHRPSFVYLMGRSSPGKADSFGLGIVVEEKIFRGCHSAAGEMDQNFLRNCEFEAGVAGRSEASEADRFYTALGASVASIVNLLDVGCAVISSDDPGFTRQRFEILREATVKGLIPVPGRSFDFLLSGMGNDGIVLGAALLALHQSLAAQVVERRREPVPA